MPYNLMFLNLLRSLQEKLPREALSANMQFKQLQKLKKIVIKTPKLSLLHNDIYKVGIYQLRAVVLNDFFKNRKKKKITKKNI